MTVPSFYLTQDALRRKNQQKYDDSAGAAGDSIMKVLAALDASGKADEKQKYDRAQTATKNELAKDKEKYDREQDTIKNDLSAKESEARIKSMRNGADLPSMSLVMPEMGSSQSMDTQGPSVESPGKLGLDADLMSQVKQSLAEGTAPVDWKQKVAESKALTEAEKRELLKSQTEATNALTDLRNRTKRVGSGPHEPTSKERKAEADAKVAEAKAAALGKEAPSNFAITKETKNKLQRDRSSVVTAQKAANAVRELTKKYNLEDFIGPIDGVKNELMSKLGMQSEQAAEITSTIRRAFTEYKVAATGAAAGVKEMADLKTQVPNEQDQLPQLIGKLNAGDDIMSQALKSIDDQLASGDVRGATTAIAAQHDDATIAAAQRYRAAPKEQQAAVDALIQQGIDRVQAVAQVLGN